MPFTHEPTHISVDGFSIAVTTVTNGNPNGLLLVWIHGLGADSTTRFQDLAHHAALSGVRSFLVDLPGHGTSDRPQHWSYGIEEMASVVSAGLAQLTHTPVALFGHSLGGSVAISAASQRPDLYSRLIVAEPNLDPGVGTTSVSIARQHEAEFVDVGYARLVEGTRRLARQGNTDAATWLPSLLKADPIALHRSATSLLAIRNPTFRELLPQLPMPIAMITGDRSSRTEQLFMETPHLEGYVVRNAGHQMFDNNPDHFATILASLLQDDAPDLVE